MEEWKEIPGYNGKYLISNLGRIKSTYGKQERIMRLSKSGKYQILNLSHNGNVKTYMVQSLMGKVWMEKPDEESWIKHIDGNTMNNDVNNLAWSKKGNLLKESFENGSHSKIEYGHRYIRVKDNRIVDVCTSIRNACMSAQTDKKTFEKILRKLLPDWDGGYWFKIN